MGLSGHVANLPRSLGLSVCLCYVSRAPFVHLLCVRAQAEKPWKRGKFTACPDNPYHPDTPSLTLSYTHCINSAMNTVLQLLSFVCRTNTIPDTTSEGKDSYTYTLSPCSPLACVSGGTANGVVSVFTLLPYQRRSDKVMCK